MSNATILTPLSDLYIHPLNTRSEPPAADIEALADSIDAWLPAELQWPAPETPEA